MAVAVGELRRRQEAMEFLVSEVARGDDEDIPSAIQVAVERGWVSGIVDTMIQAKAKKETEIDRICYRHYGDFLASVKEIVHMRDSAAELTSTVGQLHEDFSSTGQELVHVLSELDKLNSERESIRRGLEIAEQCRDISKLMFEARKQIMQQDHYAALHTIDKIQTEYANVAVGGLVSILHDWLPRATAQVLEGVRAEANNYIIALRSNGNSYGNIMLHRQAKALLALSRRNFKAPVTLGERFSISLQHIRRHANVFQLDKWAAPNLFETISPYVYSLDESHAVLMDSFFEDMAPLHKAIYTYSLLGKQTEFHIIYRNDREKELNAIVDGAALAISKRKKLVDVFPNLVASLIGFFAIEIMCSRSIDVAEGSSKADLGPFSFQEISLLWESICSRVDDLIATSMQQFAHPDDVLQVKEELLLMIETIADEALGLKQHCLYESMRKLWTRFLELQLEWIANECITALDQSAYQPLQINSDEEYASQIKAYKLDAVQFEVDSGGASAYDDDANGTSNTGAKKGLAAANLDALEADMNFSQSSSFVPFAPNSSIAVGNATSSTGHPFNGDDDVSDDSSAGAGSEDDFGDVVQGGLDSDARLLSPSSSFMTRTYPFSAAVPRIMHALHVLVVRFFLFAHRNAHLSACGESVCNAVYGAYEVLGSRLMQETVVDGADTPLSKACQISIDSTAFAAVSDTLWEIIESALNHFRWSDSVHSHLPNSISNSKLYLNRISGQAQDFVFELLAYKVDDLLTSLWLNSFEPVQRPTRCHDEIEELVDFLSITFMGLTHLPQHARETAHFTCCARVAEAIEKHILSSKVPRLNIYAFVAIDIDVQRLLQFAEDCHVPHLRQCFTDLIELCQLMLSPQLTAYIESASDRNRKFSRVDSNKLLTLLEKMTPIHDSWNGVHHDKNSFKNMVKKLRTQIR